MGPVGIEPCGPREVRTSSGDRRPARRQRCGWAEGAEQTLSIRPFLFERMRDPKDDLRPLIARGKQLQQEVAQLTAEIKVANPRVSAGIGLADIVFDLRGYKRFATAAGKYLAWSGLINRSRALSASFEQWYNETISKLRTISVARKNITRRGNSAALVTRLAKARSYMRVDTQIGNAVGVLGAVVEDELVFNEDIHELIARRRQELQEERRRAKEEKLLDLSDLAPGIDLVKLFNREQLRARFSNHTEVGRMIEGAFDAHSSHGADANRQALSSCRSAIELLVKEMTGEDAWRVGLVKIAEGKRRKLVSDTYGFLSGYGSHPGGVPTKKDVAYGIRMTLGSCLWLVETEGPEPS